MIARRRDEKSLGLVISKEPRTAHACRKAVQALSGEM
jgi:predicted RNA-binding protein YlqC (UPF0109 family)